MEFNNIILQEENCKSYSICDNIYGIKLCKRNRTDCYIIKHYDNNIYIETLITSRDVKLIEPLLKNSFGENINIYAMFENKDQKYVSINNIKDIRTKVTLHKRNRDNDYFIEHDGDNVYIKTLISPKDSILIEPLLKTNFGKNINIYAMSPFGGVTTPFGGVTTPFGGVTIQNDEYILDENDSSLKQINNDEELNRLSKKRKFNTIENDFLSATTTKYFTNDDSLGYILKLLKINTTEDLIGFICNGTLNDNNVEHIDSVKKFIFQRGCDYEKHIINNILNCDFVVQVNQPNVLTNQNKLSFYKVTDDSPPKFENYKLYLNNTNIAMENGIDIIYQGMIECANDECKFRGFPDLIVSKKAFLKLFYNYLDRETTEMKLDINNLDSYNDYIIIDIKSSILQLNADGKTCRNTELAKLYKTQLAVYCYIMNCNSDTGVVTPPKGSLCNDVNDKTIFNRIITKNKSSLAFIFPYGIKIDYKNITQSYYNPITRQNKYFIINVDLNNKDINYYIQLTKIYSDYKACINSFNKFLLNGSMPITFLFDDQINELKEIYNNRHKIEFSTKMDDIIRCNTLLNINTNDLANYSGESQYNIPYVKGNYVDKKDVKMWLAQQTRSLSLLRGINMETCKKLKDNENIYSYVQTEDILNNIDKYDIKEKEIVKSIIKANSLNYDKIFYVKDKKSKLTELKKIFNNDYIICLDFETIPFKLLKNGLINGYDFETDTEYNNFGHGQKIFMIGFNIYKKENNTGASCKFVKFDECQITIDDVYKNTTINNLNQVIDDLICKSLLKMENIVTNKLHNVNKNKIKFIIWSQFEINVLKNYRHIIKNMNGIYRLFDIEIVDILELFTNKYNPIGVKGAFNYSIKSIGKALLNNNLLDHTKFWSLEDKSCSNGMDAMYNALWYYIDKKNKKEKEDIMSSIKYYNNVDCNIMADILNITNKNI